MLLVSPSEPGPMRALGVLSGVPERFGSDVLFPVPGGLGGVQRKTVADFLVSVRDGRLHREVGAQASLAVRGLVLEGELAWTDDARLAPGPGWTAAALLGLLWSLQAVHGCVVWRTRSLAETTLTVPLFARWAAKRRHRGTAVRPKEPAEWGTRTNREWQRHVLQGFPGIGPERAEAILAHFGRVPLRWTASAEDLARVPGLGPGTASSLHELLEWEVSDRGDGSA